MSQTWPDTLSEILSFLTYGWSFHEIVYKRRMGTTGRPETNSVYSDGLIGLRKLAIRSQETLYQWEYDGEDNLIGMTQLPPPDFGLRTIPFEKAVLFRTKSRKNNPEGRSILRSAYRDWYFKKRIQEIEGIGIERDLAGLPVLTAPTGADVWSDDEDMQATYARASDIVSAIRRDEIDGVVLPGPPDETRAGWKLELLASTGKRSFDTSQVIERYDNRIAMSMMADFILLGHQAVGSFALSDNKTELFAVALGSYLDIICEAINTQVFPKLIGLNAEHFKGITEVPEMTGMTGRRMMTRKPRTETAESVTMARMHHTETMRTTGVKLIRMSWILMSRKERRPEKKMEGDTACQSTSPLKRESRQAGSGRRT